MKITGKTLIAWGYRPGPWFAAAIAAAEKARASGAGEAAIRAVVDGFAPPPEPAPVGLRAPGDLAYTLNIRAEEPEDADNIASVERHMADLMRVPTLTAGTVMPDACPAGAAPGTIPVGGVVAAKDAIHPGMHSADICCSMALSVFGDANPTALLDAGMKVSHFGGGGRTPSHDIDAPGRAAGRVRREQVPRHDHRGGAASTSAPKATATISSTSAAWPRRDRWRSSPTTARASLAPCSTRPAWTWPRATGGACRRRRRRTTPGFPSRPTKGAPTGTPCS